MTKERILKTNERKIESLLNNITILDKEIAACDDFEKSIKALKPRPDTELFLRPHLQYAQDRKTINERKIARIYRLLKKLDNNPSYVQVPYQLMHIE